MTEPAMAFDDAAAYEHFMGRWSRSTGAIFLHWLDPPHGARWLDVGCGTGVFTELILDSCTPSAVTAVDPSHAQIEHARQQPVGKRAEFHVAGAQSLAFQSGTFDVVASALVINFIPDRPAAIKEMRRVARPGGIIAGYIWDFKGECSTGSPLRLALRDIGIEPPAVPGVEDSTLEALATLFKQAGLEGIATRTIEVSTTFPDFNDYWTSQTPSINPMTKMILALPEARRNELIEAARRRLRPDSDGRITYSARANAVKARAPA